MFIDEDRELCFKIRFDCDNDQFRPDPAIGIIEVLEHTLIKLKRDRKLWLGQTQTVTDINGNRIGGWKLFYKDNE